MKIVISDTTPINYLVLIGAIEFLPKLYELVVIPEAVNQELISSSSPKKVRDFIKKKPKWLKIAEATKNSKLLKYQLDIGELEAISLAIKLKCNLLLDEKLGRIAASENEVRVVGTIGIIGSLATLGYVDFEVAIAKLEQTNFRYDKRIIEKVRQLLKS